MERESANESDSEGRESVAYDSDLDPEYTYEESEEGSLSAHESRSFLSAGPSSLRPLDLSESESSSDDPYPKKGEPYYDLSPEYSFGPTNYDRVDTNNDGGDTNYDFSKILELQTKITEARQEQDKQSVSAVNTPQCKPETEECNVSELLARGEKSSLVEEQSFSESESENEEEETAKTVTITLQNPTGTKELSRKKNRLAKFQRHLQIVRRENQLLLHKFHLLCIIAHGNFLNSTIINNDSLYGYLLSLLPEGYGPYEKITPSYIKKLMNWFVKTFDIDITIRRSGQIYLEKLELAVCEKKIKTLKDGVVLFVSLLRGLGLIARLVISLQPTSLRVKEISDTTTVDRKKKAATSNKASTHDAEKSPKKSVQMPDESQSSTAGRRKGKQNKAGSTSKTPSSKTKTPLTKTKTPPSKATGGKQKKMALAKTRGKKPVEVLSSDSDEDSPRDETKCGIDYWVEVYLEKEERWICADILTLKVDSPSSIYARCTQPVSYIVGWLNDNTLKDITRRYMSSWLMKSKKTRVDEDWWTATLQPFRGCNTLLDMKEDELLDENDSHIQEPMPTKISAFKNHPLYALQRHLLKFEGIYPSDAAPLGFVRGEAVYSRFCVHELFSREKWIRQGKCVRVNEKPYKIVKSRSKSDSGLGGNKPLELYGHWQVEDYIAPPAVDGKVPRNEYGNVEVYKPSMVPAGTVHLQVPGLLKIARKLDIDCAPAVTGWEHHAGRSHPVIDGVIVCKEFQDILMDAWNADFDASTLRSEHKRKQAIYKKWLKLVKSVIVKSNLKKKYNFGGDQDNEPPSKLLKKC